METSNLNFTGSTADLCGRRVLKTGGSLTGYIMTGNAYDKDYYAPSLQNKNSQAKKKKSHKKLFIALAGLGSVIVTGVLIKKGKIKPKELFNKVKNYFKDKSAKEILSSAKDKVTKA